MRYALNTRLNAITENNKLSDPFVHYQTFKTNSEKKRSQTTQKKIDEMIKRFNSDVEWDKKRVDAYIAALNFILYNNGTSSTEKIEWAASKDILKQIY